MISIRLRNMATTSTTRGKKAAVVCVRSTPELWKVKLKPKRTMNMTIMTIAIGRSLLPIVSTHCTLIFDTHRNGEDNGLEERVQ